MMGDQAGHIRLTDRTGHTHPIHGLSTALIPVAIWAVRPIYRRRMPASTDWRRVCDPYKDFPTLVGNGRQLMVAGRSRYVDSGLFTLFSRGLGIQCIKNRGANKDGEKEGNYIHADTEQEGLPAADGVKCLAFHGFQIKKVFKGIMNSSTSV
jgi:hypothetical protein